MYTNSVSSSSIWSIDMILSDAPIQCQSWHGSDGNKVVPCIPQNSSITEALPSDCLVSYTEHSLKESFSSAER